MTRLIASLHKIWRRLVGRPRYFDFARHRKPAVVLHDFISAITSAIIGLAYTIGGAVGGTFVSSMVGATIGGTFYGVSIAGALAWVAVAGALYGASTLATSLMAKSGKQSSLSTGGLLQNTSMIIDPIRVVYGKTRIGCSQVFVHAEGGVNNPRLHVIAVWGEGPVEGMETDGLGDMIWIGERRMQDFQAYSGLSYVSHEFYNGSWEQNISSELQSHFAAWADAHRGTAYSYFQLQYSPFLFTTFPQFTCILKGRKLFDPRDGSISYSRNPALVWRDFKTHPRYGGGIAGSMIDKQSVIDAANWCDSNGFYFDGCIADRKEFLENIEDILLCFRAEEIWSGGLYKLLIQKYDAPVMSLSEKDIFVDERTKGCAMGIGTAGIQDYPKRIKISFSDPTNQYIPSYCYWPETTPYEAETDRETREIILIGVADFEESLKLGKYFYLRSKYSNIFNFIAHPRVSCLEIGDMVEVSHDPAFPVGSIPEDWTNKVLRVLGIFFSENNQIALTLGDEDSSIYDPAVNVAAHTYYSSESPSQSDLPEEPTNPSASTGEDTTTTARDDAYLNLQWDNMGVGVSYQIRYRKPADTWWQQASIFDPGGECDIPTKSVDIGPMEMESGGNFAGGAELTYVVEIDGGGTPSTFRWSDDGGSTWDGTGIAITANWQNLNNGVKIKFSATGGGFVSEQWTFKTRPKTPVKTRLGGLPVGTVFIWQVRSGKNWFAWSEWATSPTLITTWKPTTGPSMADVSLSASSEGSIVLLEWTKTIEDPNLQSWLIYRNTTNNSATAILLDEKSYPSRSFRDSMVVSSQSYYYWLKGRDRNGNVSSEFSMGVNIEHRQIARSWTFTTIAPSDVPAVGGTIGYAVDKISLTNCDDSTSWVTDSPVAGSIVMSTEKTLMVEGTGCLKVEISRYPKVRYYEGGSWEHNFGLTLRYLGQSFKLATAKDIKAVALKIRKVGSPGDITAEIYTDSAGKPGSSLGSCTIAASGISTSYGSAPKDFIYGIFATPISLSASTKYWLIFSVASADPVNYYKCLYDSSGTPPSGAFGDADEQMATGTNLTTTFSVNWMQDLAFRVCVAGDLLNRYFYVRISAADISLKSFLKNYIRSSRTGGFLSQSFGETAIGEQNFAISIATANLWEMKASDITGVGASSRDGVIWVGFKITNMDEDAIIYIDDIFANIGEPRPAIYRGSALEYILTSSAFDLTLLRTLQFPFLMKNPAIICAERTTAGSSAFTVPSGKIWILLHLFITAYETWTLNDISMPVTTETKMHFDTILSYGDHFDLTSGGSPIRVWYLELDADSNFIIKTMIHLDDVVTYTVPSGYTLIITRIINMAGSTNNLLADNKTLFDCHPELRDFVGIFDEGTVLKASTYISLRFIGFLIPKET